MRLIYDFGDSLYDVALGEYVIKPHSNFCPYPVLGMHVLLIETKSGGTLRAARGVHSLAAETTHTVPLM